MKFQMHTKAYYLKMIQKGNLSKEKVAEIFDTSVENVEEALMEYNKNMNPLRKMDFEKRNAFWQIGISLVSTMLVLFTLLEMQEARNATYMPDISLDKIELAGAWDSDGAMFHITEEVSDVVSGFLVKDELNQISKIKVYNIGV